MRAAIIALAAATWSGSTLAFPHPSVPGEILVQIRVPAVNRDKSGALAYKLPSLIEKELAGAGLISVKPLSKPSTGNKRGGVRVSGPNGVFLLKFKGNQKVENHVEKAKALPGISIAEPNYVGTLCAAPSDEFYVFNQKEVFDRMGFEEAWEYSTGSPDTVIAVLDSGIDTTHPDFEGRLLPGYNFISDSTDVYDPLGHGTRVAGILGARGGDSGPGSGMTGICWDCRLLPVVVAGIDRAVTVADLIEAINYSVDQGAGVINMSLAIGGESKLLENACNAAAKQAILVAAAGNQGQNFVPLFPAGFDSVIGVSSLDENGDRSAFSNYNLPGVNEFVDFAAPGEGVFTTIPAWLYDSERTNGTSFAAPFVAGTAALLRSLYPEQSPGAIRSHMESHVEKVGSLVRRGVPEVGNLLARPIEADLRIASVKVLDYKWIASSGFDNDEDFSLDGGESAQIQVEIQNLGADIGATTAELHTSSPFITVVTGSVLFGAIPYGEISDTSRGALVIEVSESAPQTTAIFQLTVSGHPLIEFQLPIEKEAPIPREITKDLILGATRTWIISGTTTVTFDATLTVSEGVTVKFEANSRLVVEGGLESEGSLANPVRWLNRTPPPEFHFSSPFDFPVGENPQAVTVGDIDGDGLLDVATANYDSNDISVLLNDGKGGFLPQSRYASGEGPIGLVIADVDRDLRMEIVVANSKSNDLSRIVLLESGVHTEERILGPDAGDFVVSADITGDGSLDIITGATNGLVTVLDESENATNPLGAILSPMMAAVGNLSSIGSGEEAIILSESSVIPQLHRLWSTSPGIVETLPFFFAPAAQFVAIGKLIPAQRSNILILEEGGFILHGLNFGGMPIMNQEFLPLPTSFLTAADFSGDGLDDLVIVSQEFNTLMILETFSQSGYVVFLWPIDSLGGFKDPSSAAIGDIIGNGAPDIVVANAGADTVSLLPFQPQKGFPDTRLNPPQIQCLSARVQIWNSFFSLPGSVSLEQGGVVVGSLFEAAGSDGLIVSGSAVISDCTAVGCMGWGFDLADTGTPANRLLAMSNRGPGIRADAATSCVAKINDGTGVSVHSDGSNLIAEFNDGVGIAAGGTVSGSIASRNTEDGIQALVATQSLSAGNSRFGIIAKERVDGSIAVANGQGIRSPLLENSRVIGTFGSALAEEGTVNDSAILENASISSDTIQFNNTILADNGEEAQLDQIDGMYIAGNEGGGVRGVPVSNSTIIGNKGPGVDQNVMVTNSNIAFNEGPGVVGGEVSNVFAHGNRDGELTAGAIGILSAEPVQDAPAFLSNVQINLATITLEPTQTLGVGRAEFVLTYSKDMDTARRLWVTFGQSSPFTSFIVNASPGWTDSRTWKGYFDVGGEVGSGIHTLRVSGARALPDSLFPGGFEIPPDTYHRFVVDTDLGLQVSNGRVVARTENSLTLAWDPSKDISPLGFSVVRSRTGREFQHVASLTMNATEFLDQGLDSNTTYYYQVYESVTPNSHRQLTNPFAGTTGDPFTPTPTATPSPGTTPTLTPCFPQDLYPDCRADARDLLVLLGGVSSRPATGEILFLFAQGWMENASE